MTTTETNNVDAIAELAQAAVEPVAQTVGTHQVLYGAYPPGWQLQHVDLDLGQYQPAPDRKRGTVHVRDTDSLLAYLDLQMGTVDEHGGAVDRLPVVYYDPEKFSAVAVLNGHTDAGPGWGDHRAELQLQATPRQRPPAAGPLVTGPMWPSRQAATGLSHQSIYRIMTEASHRAGHHYSPHGYRHTAATEMVLQGAPLEVVRRVLGHEDLSTLGAYTDAQVEECRPWVARGTYRAEA